jgi:hypothetical protein
MNDIQINIEDYNLVKTSIINNIKIKIMKIELYKSITLSVSLLTNNINIDNKIITISGKDYNNWGNDDNYIVNFVLNNLGLTKKI